MGLGSEQLQDGDLTNGEELRDAEHGNGLPFRFLRITMTQDDWDMIRTMEQLENGNDVHLYYRVYALQFEDDEVKYYSSEFPLTCPDCHQYIIIKGAQ